MIKFCDILSDRCIYMLKIKIITHRCWRDVRLLEFGLFSVWAPLEDDVSAEIDALVCLMADPEALTG